MNARIRFADIGPTPLVMQETRYTDAERLALARLTVVVPVGPGDHVCQRLRAQLERLPANAHVCVVACDDSRADGSDATSVAGVHEAPGGTAIGPSWHWLRAPTGRAVQQNAGAAAAEGDWLWFVHADATLAAETLPALARFIAADVPALGYFDLRFLGDGPALTRINAAGARLRSRWLRLPFGDQGFVLPRAAFASLGGFDPATRRGEDHQLVWRARRAGLPVTPIGAPIYTSARRYATSGWAATTGGHLLETWRQAWRFARTDRPAR
ncbi:MAG: glycosyltransferase [Luteimonas sp.]